MADIVERRWHRIRFYPEAWSSFDGMEPCKRPDWCLCCEFKHPFCTEEGRALPTPPASDEESETR